MVNSLIIRFIIFGCSFVCAVSRNVEQPRYNSTYACEGKVLRIACKPGDVINLVRANYGRFSITLCNEHGNTEWSVNCMSQKSLRVLHNRCSLQQNCSILASTTIFSDPCPGTLKYLEAHYLCQGAASATTPKNIPNPPWIVTSQSNLWSTPKVVSLRPPLVNPNPPVFTTPKIITQPTTKLTTSQHSTTERTAVTQRSTTVITTTQQQQPTTLLAFSSNVSTTVISYDTTSVVSTIQTQHFDATDLESLEKMCPPAKARGLFWNWTRGGESAIQQCPGGATGLAQWYCFAVPTLHRPPYPDLSECRSVWLTSLDTRINQDDALTGVANDLSQVTSSKTLYGGDMMTTTEMMKKLAKKMSNNIQTYPDQRQREAIVTELLHAVLRTGSNLLDISQLSSWHDLFFKEQMVVATSFLIGIEENSFLLADTVIYKKTITHKERNIHLNIRVIETDNIGDEMFISGSGEVDGSWSDHDNWIRLQKRPLLENRSEGNLLRIVYLVFDKLEDILKPSSDVTSNKIVNSKIVSASLGKGRHIQLSEPVTICLKHIITENISNPQCVFWNFTGNSWSDEGCRVKSTNSTHTICTCDHLTNFALIMEVSSDEPFLSDNLLKFITYAGAIISIICLLLAILTFQIFENLKCEHTTILKNLCLCLLIAEVLFIALIGKSEPSVYCGVLTGFLHYFFLCAFTWLFLESFQLYVSLIEAFKVDNSRVKWFYMFAYIAPLIVIIISCVVDPTRYIKDNFSLRADNFFIFTAAATIIADIVFIVMAMYMVHQQLSTSVTVKTKEHSQLTSTKIWLRGSIVVATILSAMWIYGLLYLDKEAIFTVCIFTIINCFCNLFIFIFHCVRSKKVQREYKRCLRQYSLLSRCVGSENQNTGTKERRENFYSNSQANAHSTESTSASSAAASGLLNQPEPNIYVKTTPRKISSETDVEIVPSLQFEPIRRPDFNKSYNRKKDRDKDCCSDVFDCSKNYQTYGFGHSHALKCQHKKGSFSPVSPCGHTYQEIRDRSDPVYEEIERDRDRHVSESDDERKHSSDMSRQSSRSYGDHRPLIDRCYDKYFRAASPNQERMFRTLNPDMFAEESYLHGTPLGRVHIPSPLDYPDRCYHTGSRASFRTSPADRLDRSFRGSPGFASFNSESTCTDRNNYIPSPVSERNFAPSQLSNRNYPPSPISNRNYASSPVPNRNYAPSPVPIRNYVPSPTHSDRNYIPNYEPPNDNFDPSVPVDKNFQSAFDAAFRQRLKEQAQQSKNSTIAVLDGSTVVCHLQPNEQPYSEC